MTQAAILNPIWNPFLPFCKLVKNLRTKNMRPVQTLVDKIATDKHFLASSWNFFRVWKKFLASFSHACISFVYLCFKKLLCYFYTDDTYLFYFAKRYCSKIINLKYLGTWNVSIKKLQYVQRWKFLLLNNLLESVNCLSYYV